MSKVTIATVAMNVSYNKESNVKKYLHYINEAAKQGAKLIVLPEQSLQGYLPSLIGPISNDTLRYQHANAEVIPEGETTQLLIKEAQKHGMYICWGMTERDRNRYDALYNAAVLVGPEGFIGSYRKVHLPLDELHIYYPGNEFPVYDTDLGKIGLLICYDKSFPEATRELALQGAEIFLIPIAWNVDPDPVTNRVGYLYDMYDRVRAAENQCWLISSNQVGVCGDTNYYGHSNIVEPGGFVIATTGANEGVAYSEVDIRSEILRARTEDMASMYLIKDRKPYAYKNLTTRHEVGGLTPLQR